MRKYNLEITRLEECKSKEIQNIPWLSIFGKQHRLFE